MSPQNLTNVYNQNPTLQSNYTLQQYLDLFGGSSTPPPATIPPSDPNAPTTPIPPSDPNAPTTPIDPGQGIIGADINQGGYNPYIANANVRTDYQPNYDFRQFSEYGANPSTMDIKKMDMNQNYFNKPAPSGIQQAMLTAAGFIPGVGTAIKGAQFLGNALKGVMPINERAILENELRGSGVYVDDIGRIALAPGQDYNSVEGIMAGYNANQMTDKTFDKRTDKIADTLSSKYGVDISSLSEEDISDFDPKNPAFDLVSRFGFINKAKTNFLNNQKKAKEIAEFKKAEKERKKREKEFNDRVAAEAATAARARARNESVYASADRQGFTNRDGGFSTSRGDRAGTSEGSGQFSPSSSRGRSGYRYGGRTSYFNGGIVSLGKK